MAFKQVEKGHFHGRLATKNRVALMTSNKGSMLNVIVSGDIFEDMGAPAFAKIAVGTGEHSGMLLIKGTTHKKGAYRITLAAGSKATSASSSSWVGQRKLTITAAKVGVMKTEFRTTTAVRHEMTDAGLVLHLRQA